MTIEVMYSCNGCGLVKVPAQVPARTTEDVVHWARVVLGTAIGSDHRKRSPFCTSRTMSEVWIPTTGTEKIGGPGIN